MKSFPVPDHEILVRDLHHVIYEIHMMWNAAVHLPQTPPRTFSRNACLESFLIHARGLLEFFSSKPKGGADDMRASDFVPNFPPIAAHPEQKRMHKEVGHLTYSRKNRGEQRTWDARVTAKPILEKSLAFLENVQKNAALMSDPKTKDEAEKMTHILREQIRGYAFPMDLASQLHLSSSSIPSVINVPEPYKGRVTFVLKD